jgi:hypothetical protein
MVITWQQDHLQEVDHTLLVGQVTEVAVVIKQTEEIHLCQQA